MYMNISYINMCKLKKNREVQEFAKCDKVKIVACDGKNTPGHGD